MRLGWTGTQLCPRQKTCVGSSSCCPTVLSLYLVSQDHCHFPCESVSIHVDRMCNRQKISRWIVIVQEFYLDFVSVKSKKFLVFAELISELMVESCDVIPEESPIKGDMFFIASLDP
jgi:hypothetical protein